MKKFKTSEIDFFLFAWLEESSRGVKKLEIAYEFDD